MSETVDQQKRAIKSYKIQLKDSINKYHDKAGLNKGALVKPFVPVLEVKAGKYDLEVQPFVLCLDGHEMLHKHLTPALYKLDTKPGPTYGNIQRDVPDPDDLLGGTMKVPVLCGACRKILTANDL